MRESPEEWLEELFEYEDCPECGRGADNHEVCLVPGIGTYFARCKHPEVVADGGTTERLPRDVP
jgi:hypothetical protein